MSVLQGSAEGEVLYVETHSAVTNANGLLTLEIGGGKTEQGAFDRINWANGPYFLKTETDPNGGGNYSITSVQQLLSVPYALYAREAANGFSGDYNDLKNKPVIPQNVGELSNDAGYITLNDLPEPPKSGDSPKSAGVIQTDACGEIDLCQLANLLAQQQAQMDEMRNALLPTVTTASVSNTTASTASCGGTVTDQGYSAVTARGVCWSAEPNPTVADSHTSDSTGTGEFTSTLTDLQPSTTYYVRAYATNSVGTAYGEVVSFTTSAACVAITLPYSEDFESYTTSTTAATGVEPNCWELVHEDAAMTDANRPQLYYNSSFAHSGSYSLKLYYRGIYAMPELDEEIDISQVKLDMYLRQANAKYQLQVGVWDGQNFVQVATFNNSTTDVEHVTCDFSNYTGNGRRIAFRNTLGSGSTVAYSSNYLDDITLSVNTGTVCEAITLPYSEDFESYTTSTTAATGMQPNCWRLVHEDAAMTDANRPQLYYNSNFAHSGSYSLKLYNRGIYAMPALSEDVELNQVKLEMYLRQANARYQLQVGIWEEDGTFVPVATFNNSTTEVEHVTCDFSSYIGSGRRIAFRNTLGSGGNLNYSTNYLDDIVLSVNGGAVVDEKSCPGTPTVTDHEGNVYATVQIGEQCWMRENLRTTHYADGTVIPAGGDNDSKTEPYYYDYSTHSLPLEVRGYLYNWPAAMHGASSSNANPSGVQGICPTGWHLPSDAEWTQLTDYVGSQSEYRCGGNSSYIAKALASTEGWNTHTGSCTVGNDQTSNNASGFSVVPAGYWNYGFYNAGYGANFWSSTECGTNYAWFRYLDYDDATVGGGNGYRSDGFSVRCLRDETGAGTAAVVDEKSCPGTPTVTDHEGNVYATVQIGNQCWMRDNLRTTHYADGDSIPAGGSNSSSTQPYYYDYSTHSLPLEVRGYLYNWPAAMHGAASSSANPSGVQGICPTGWHLPSDAEWTQLTDYVKTQSDYVCGGNTSSIAKALASTEGWKTSTSSCEVGNDPTSNNASGFSVVPAGYWYDGFGNAGSSATFWSSSEYGTNYAWRRYLYYDLASVSRSLDGNRKCGFSVRCLRD